MKTIYKQLIALLVLSCFHFAAVAASEFKLPDYKKVTLNNGLTLVLMEQHEVPLIDVNIRVKAGAIDNQILGLADVTGDALRFGAGKRSKQELDQALDFVGAYLGTWASTEQSGLNASFAKKDSQLVLDIIADVLMRPQFDQQELDKYLTRYAAQIEQRKESPKAVINDYFNQLVFGTHPYATPVMANKASLAQINREAIKRFYGDFYQTGNTVVVVVGDFSTSKMLKQLKRRFGSWKNTSKLARNPLPKLTPLKDSQVLLVDKGDAIETTFQIGGLGIARNNPDFVAVSVINTILGGRFTSWLNDALRVNSGLTYGARSTFDSLKHGGRFYISTFTKSSTTKEAIDLALATYDKLWSQGIDQKTLDSAKAYVKGQFPPDYETSGQLASLLADMQIYGFDASFINDFSNKVDALNVATAKHIIEQYFPKQNLQFVLIGKAADVRDIAKSYGKVTEVSIKD